MVKAAKTPAKSASRSKKNGCTLTVKPKVLLSNLTLLNAAVTSNQQGLDRLCIEVSNGQSIFSVGGDIGVRITHKANKTSTSPTVQVSCRQLKNYAATLDNSNHKLHLSPEQVAIANQKETYQHSLITYKDTIPEHNADFTAVAQVKASEFKQALDRVTPFADSDIKSIISGICLQLQAGTNESTEESESLELTLTGLSEPGMGHITLQVDSVENDDMGAVDNLVLVLPKRAATFIANNAEDFTLSISEKSVRFSWGNVECTVQTLKGKFPDLEKIKASVARNDTSVEFNRNELQAALKRHQVASSEIEFKIDAEECTLTQFTEAGSGAENIYCSNDNDDAEEPIRLSLPIDYLVKVVASVKSETIGLQLNLVPEEGEDVACNNILVEDDDAVYCLTQLVAE